MTKPAAIRADFADFRQVKSRKVAQLIFEVPLEQLPEVMEVLGWPRPDANIIVGIARLVLDFGEVTLTGAESVAEIGPGMNAEQSAHNLPSPSASGEGQDTRRTYTRSQMAAILCADPAFQEWLRETNPKAYRFCDPSWTERDCCDWALKLSLVITSKKDLDDLPEKGADWDKLYNSFKYREMAR
jgi:hypothetical protein